MTIDYIDDTDEEFTYDKLGNRTGEQDLREGSETYVVNSLTNRYNSVGGNSLTYDDAGNLTTDPNGYEYEYDYENRLIKITKGETDIAEYAYDALGRRIQVYDMVAETKTQYYYNDNWQVLKETDDEGYSLRSYIYGNYIDEVLVMIDPNVSEDFYYAHDHLFSTVALMENDGDVVERYEYDAYGKPYFMDASFNLLATQKSAYNNPYGFTGRRIDIHDNGNLVKQHSRYRDYEYYNGRMMQHDPLGIVPNAQQPNVFIPIWQFSDGANLYKYGGCYPLIVVDPYGLWLTPDTLWDIASVIYDVGKITVGIVTDNPKLIADGTIDLGADTFALLIPGLPAGGTKVARFMGKKGGKVIAENGTEVIIKIRKSRRKMTQLSESAEKSRELTQKFIAAVDDKVATNFKVTVKSPCGNITAELDAIIHNKAIYELKAFDKTKITPSLAENIAQQISRQRSVGGQFAGKHAGLIVEDVTKISDEAMKVFKRHEIEVQTISEFTESMAKAKITINNKTVLDFTQKSKEVIKHEK